MIIDQLSIFVNNAVGRLTEVTKILGAAGINMHAFTLSESSDFGILRLITDNTEKAYEVLLEASFAVKKTPVVLVELGDEPGALAMCIQKISDAGISVEYMYAFSHVDSASVVIRTDDVELCEEIINK